MVALRKHMKICNFDSEFTQSTLGKYINWETTGGCGGRLFADEIQGSDSFVDFRSIFSSDVHGNASECISRLSWGRSDRDKRQFRIRNYGGNGRMERGRDDLEPLFHLRLRHRCDRSLMRDLDRQLDRLLRDKQLLCQWCFRIWD